MNPSLFSFLKFISFLKLHEVGKFRIVLKNEEDIKNWREERRKWVYIYVLIIFAHIDAYHLRFNLV